MSHTVYFPSLSLKKVEVTRHLKKNCFGIVILIADKYVCAFVLQKGKLGRM
jgi:hypothetical protein